MIKLYLKQLNIVLFPIIFILLLIIKYLVKNDTTLLYLYYERYIPISMSLLVLLIPTVSLHNNKIIFEMQSIKNVINTSKNKFKLILSIIFVMFVILALLDIKIIFSSSEAILSSIINIILFSFMLFEIILICKSRIIAIVYLLIVDFTLANIYYPLYNQTSVYNTRIIILIFVLVIYCLLNLIYRKIN